MRNKPFFLPLLLFVLLITKANLHAGFPTIDDLTLEEKVGQLLIVHFNGNTANEEARRLIQEAHVGGFIYYNWANGLDSPSQVKQLSSGLQNLALAQLKAIPLFIAVDQEGGAVRRLVKGFTSFPGNAALGRTNRPELAEQSALCVGRELKAVGVNVNFAPVVDVNSNADNPVIGIRSFGKSVDQVAVFGEASLRGYRKAGIIACLKHFPGHGDVTQDPHGGLPVLKKRLDELTGEEFLPFHRLSFKADMLMTGHIMLPRLDQRKCATASFVILENILRKGMRYQGVIISDSLVMQGMLDNNAGKIENAVVNSFMAGCDILLLGGKQLLSSQNGFELSTDDVIGLHRHLVKCVQNGRIPEKRLNTAVSRILKLKQNHPAFNDLTSETTSLAAVGSQDHQALAEEIAKLSVQIHRSAVPLPLDVSGKKITVIASDIVADDLTQTPLWTAADEQYLFKGLQPSSQEQDEIKHIAANADVVVVCTYNAWANPEQLHLIKDLEENCPLLCVIALRDARDADCFDQAAVVVSTVSPVAASITATTNLILKI